MLGSIINRSSIISTLEFCDVIMAHSSGEELILINSECSEIYNNWRNALWTGQSIVQPPPKGPQKYLNSAKRYIILFLAHQIGKFDCLNGPHCPKFR